MFGIQTKFIAYGLAVVAIIGFCYWAVDEIGDKREAEVRAEYTKLAEEQRLATLSKEKADRDRLHKVSTDYENQIAALKSVPQFRPMRVPSCPRTSRVPEASTAPSESIEASTDGLDRENAVDHSPLFRDYAIDCQAVAIQLKNVIEAWPARPE